MTFEDGLKLVKLRGEAMQEAATYLAQIKMFFGHFDEKGGNVLFFLFKDRNHKFFVRIEVWQQEAVDALRGGFGAIKVGSPVQRSSSEGGQDIEDIEETISVCLY